MNNFSVECPDGHGKFSGYLAPELPLKYSCPVCGIEMLGYRILSND
jgi:hypothetical protein